MARAKEIKPRPEQPDAAARPVERDACPAGTGDSLGDLLEAETLLALTRAFAQLCTARVAVCDADGRRLDRPAERGRAPLVASDAPGLYSAAVRCGERVLGRVVVLEAEPNAQTRQFADVVASVITSIAQKEAQIRRRVSELTAVYDLSGRFATAGKLETVLNIAARRICDVMDVRAAVIRLLDTETGELVLSGTWNLSREYLSKGLVTVRENPIDAAAIAGEVVYIEDAQTDPRVRYPRAARREGLVSGLCCPLAYRGQTVGVIRVYTDRRQRFTAFETALLRAVASQAAAAVVHSRLFTERLAAENYQRQVAYAGQIQRRMMPTRPPVHKRITFGPIYQPSLEVGGDFFDFISFSEGSVGLVIADVVGKGVPGALMMASVRSALRAHAHSIYDINEIVGQVNRLLFRDTLVSEFATLFYGVFSAKGDRFTYCNAGHNPPLLLRGEKFSELTAGGMVIGVSAEEKYDKDLLELRSGDILTFYTDGVTEARDFDGNIYGTQRLRNSILHHRQLEAPTLANQLHWDVRRYAGLAHQDDDITIVVAKVG